MPDYVIRQATPDDAPALAQLSHESFGYPVSTDPHPDPNGNGRTTWIATYAGRPIASVVHRRYESWWWGERVRTCGIAGVKVAAEHRGSGLMTRVFEPVLREAHDEGALISTLFATAPGIYRPLGYEVVGAYDDETVTPTAAFAGVAPGRCSLRRATVDDLPVMRDTYDAWARRHNGPLVRRGPSFPDGEDALAGATTTLAVDPSGQTVGVLRWNRNGGYGPDGVLDVHDLIALTDDAARTLLASMASHATVAPTTVISTSGLDIFRLLTPQWQWTVRRSYPYSLAVLDVPGALTSRSYPQWVEVATTFSVGDSVWRLAVSGGRAVVEPTTGSARISFTRRGFAAVWSGALSCAAAAEAGLLTGTDDVWDTLFAGGQVHIRDYF